MSEVQSSAIPYEQTHRLRPLLFVTVIVPEGQAEFAVQTANANEAAFCCVCHGRGTAPEEVVRLIGSPSKKEIVFTILRADKWPFFKKAIGERFAVSKIAKGIAYATPLDAVAGVSIYKMLSNTRLFERPIALNGKKVRKEQ